MKKYRYICKADFFFPFLVCILCQHWNYILTSVYRLPFLQLWVVKMFFKLVTEIVYSKNLFQTAAVRYSSHGFKVAVLSHYLRNSYLLGITVWRELLYEFISCLFMHCCSHCSFWSCCNIFWIFGRMRIFPKYKIFKHFKFFSCFLS